MKKLLGITCILAGIASCTNEETINEKNLVPLLNMYGEDSLDINGNTVYGEASAIEQEETEDLGYVLGPESDIPLANMYGEDSLDADGNFVYPSRDTLWNR